MAQIFQAAIYGTPQPGSNFGATGKYYGFPSANVMVTPYTDTANPSFNGVVVNSIITLLPSGGTIKEKQYFSDRTVAQVAALANA